jgi:hypothetical protein
VSGGTFSFRKLAGLGKARRQSHDSPKLPGALPGTPVLVLQQSAEKQTRGGRDVSPEDLSLTANPEKIEELLLHLSGGCLWVLVLGLHAEGPFQLMSDTVWHCKLADVGRQRVRRLLCSPDILSCSEDALAQLQSFPNVGFLILSLEGSKDLFTSAVSDHWPSLARLTHNLSSLVCLDVSGCHITDSNLEAIAEDCSGLRALGEWGGRLPG